MIQLYLLYNENAKLTIDRSQPLYIEVFVTSEEIRGKCIRLRELDRWKDASEFNAQENENRHAQRIHRKLLKLWFQKPLVIKREIMGRIRLCRSIKVLKSR